MRRAVTLSLLSILVVAVTAVAQSPDSQPASAPAPTPPQRLKRLDDLVKLVEGQNSPAARRTGAQELLAQDWPETSPRVAAILSGSNGAAKIALASVLADWPKCLDPGYVEPLLAMLAGPDAERVAAARALAAYRNAGVIPRLRTLACDANEPPARRLGAITALGFMTQRKSIDALAAVLADPDPAITQAALAAFREVTATDFPDGPAVARRWWDEMRPLTDEQWQRMQIERLVRKDRETRTRLAATEARLIKVLEANVLRAADAERVSLLSEYLGDQSTQVRLLGLRLTRRYLGEGKSPDTLPPELAARVRASLQSNDPDEQESAVRTLTMFRNPADAPTFIEMLPQARHNAVRLALINALGYVGNGPATRALLDVLEQADDQTATEAVAALGRLAERKALQTESRATLVGVLQEKFAQTKAGQPLLRERILWAMGNLADPSFASAFAAALDRQEAVAVRQAALRGITALNDPQLADALATAAGDPDNDVRRTAVEALARLGTNELHLQTLWARTTSPPESEDVIRQAALSGVAALVQRLTPQQLESWLGTQRGETPPAQQGNVSRLTALIEAVSGSENANRACLGALRAHLADLLVEFDQVPQAIVQYQAALADLHAAPAAATSTAARLLHVALVHDAYDEAVAAALGKANPAPEPSRLYEVIQAVVQPHLTREGADRVLHVLSVIQQRPPAVWPPDVTQALEQLRLRAERLKQPPPASAPASQPASAPTSKPATGNPPG